MFSRIWRIVLVEVYKLTRQRLFYLALVLMGLTVLGSIYADKIFGSAKEPSPGFIILTRALLNGFKIGAIWLVIFGSLSIAGEMTAGTIKNTLIRPYRRSEWFCAKILVLVALILLTVLIVGLPSLGLVGGTYGFRDITDPVIKDYVHLSKPIMERYLAYSLVLLILPLMAIALFGLFISVLVREVGSAVALAILLYLALDYLVLGFFEQLAPFCFNYYLDWYLVTCRDIAQGILGEIGKFQVIDQVLGLGPTITSYTTETNIMPLLKSIFVPLSYSLIFGMGALVVFQRKDILV